MCFSLGTVETETVRKIRPKRALPWNPVKAYNCNTTSKGGIDLKEMTFERLTDGKAHAVTTCG